jgi:hypothetical protein
MPFIRKTHNYNAWISQLFQLDSSIINLPRLLLTQPGEEFSIPCMLYLHPLAKIEEEIIKVVD